MAPNEFEDLLRVTTESRMLLVSEDHIRKSSTVRTTATDSEPRNVHISKRKKSTCPTVLSIVKVNEEMAHLDWKDLAILLGGNLMGLVMVLCGLYFWIDIKVSPALQLTRIFLNEYYFVCQAHTLQEVKIKGGAVCSNHF